MKKKMLGIFISILLIAVPVSSLAETIDDKAKQTISRISTIDGWFEQAKLTALDGAAGDWFGCSISIDGDYAIVGACYDDSEKGSAYIFKRNGAIWVQEAKLNASNGKESDRFGCSVSIDKNYAIVGAYAKKNWTGAAYVFKRDGTNWIEKAKLTASDGSSHDYFGCSVSIDGSRVIVGASGDYGESGSAYIFTRGCCGWEEAAKLNPSDWSVGDNFGYSVSIYGIRVIVGAFHDNDMGTDSGSAYIFNRSGATWVEEQKLKPSDGETGDEFGVSVCINENSAIVGAYGDEGHTGSAYIFNRTDTTWVEEQKLNASDGETGDEFGVSVSMESEYIIVGARGDDDMGTDSGSAYIFNQTGATWFQYTKLTAYDGEELDAFGHSVSADVDYAIVGAYLDDDLGNDSGSACIFRRYNQAPNAPEIEGRTSGIPGTPYNFTFTSTDPDGDQISYYVDWGDNKNTGWFGPFASGTPQTKSHTWRVKGKTYTIEAKTRDIYGAESIWARLEITMPRNRISYNSLFLQFLERFPNMFPILRYLIGL